MTTELTIHATTQNLHLFDLTAERMLIGSLLYNNYNCDNVADILDASYFYEQLHQRIYTKIIKEHDAGKSIDPNTLRLFISKDKVFATKPEDGPKYLMSLVHDSLALASVKNAALIIKKCYLIRTIDQLCQKIHGQITKADDNFNAEQCLEEMEAQLFTISETNKNQNICNMRTLLKSSLEKINHAAQNRNEITGLPVGFVDLDNLLDGLHKSDLIILAARPSMGKTALAINMAINIASYFRKKNSEESVAFLSLEMSAEQLMMRIISMQSGINLHAMRRGMITEDQKQKLMDITQKEIMNMPLIIDDSPILNMQALKARLRRLKRKEHIGCVFIDYLQLLKNSNPNHDRYSEITGITLALKALAKELNIPIVALSQLSRAVEQREEKIPQLSDLRESGSIEQDADVVMFLYREAYYEERKKPQEGTNRFEEWQKKMNNILNQADVIIAKHRNGPIGIKKLFFDRNTTVFKNLQL